MRLLLRLANNRNVSNDTDRRRLFTLDRFGRIAEQGWRDCDGEMDVAGYNYRCDRNSNRVVRENDETDEKDEAYRCDKLDRLKVFHRGDLDGSQAIGVAGRIRGQGWALRSSGASPADPSPLAGQGKGRRNRCVSRIIRVASRIESTAVRYLPASYARGETDNDGKTGSDDPNRGLADNADRRPDGGL